MTAAVQTLSGCVREPPAGRRIGLVVDVESRVDVGLLRASRRNAAPKGMPRGLQRIAAAALLSFELDDEGRCDLLELRSADAAIVGERKLVRMLERELATLHRAGGILLTFNGGHDLAAIRLAALRLREFTEPGASRWYRDGGYDEGDMMLELGREASLWPRLADLATAFGVDSGADLNLGRGSPELTKCEFDVVATMAVYLHVLSERHASPEPLSYGFHSLVDLIAGMDVSPRLAAAITGRLAKDLGVV